MSMEVNSNYKDYKNDYLERLQEEREKAKEVGNGQDTGKKARIFRFQKTNISAAISPITDQAGYIIWGRMKTAIRKCCMMIRKKSVVQIEMGSQM